MHANLHDGGRGGFRGTSRILVVAIVVVVAVVDVVEVIYMHAEVAFTVRERVRNTYNDTWLVRVHVSRVCEYSWIRVCIQATSTVG